MRSSTRFVPVFAIVLAAGLAATAVAEPPKPPAPVEPKQKSFEQPEQQSQNEGAAPSEQPFEKSSQSAPIAPSPDSAVRPVPVAAESMELENEESDETPVSVKTNAAKANATPEPFETEEEFVPARPFNNPLAAFDKDGNGWLTMRERKAARQGLRLSRMALMTAIDTDGDLSISDAEWAEFSATFGEGDDDWFLRRREIFRDFDGNFDGGLNRKELKRANRELQERRLDFVMQFDENSDGELSEFELAVAKNFVERRREWFFAHWDRDEDGTLDETERRNSIAVFASASNK
ncbi:MAG: EF-hand domain-containing protein [Phycisphaerales bacterium]